MTRKKWIKKCLDTWKLIIKKPQRCEYCKARNKQFHPHHIRYSWRLATRFDLENGICLCAYCHRMVHQDSIFDYEFMDWLIKLRGKEWYDDLCQRSEVTVKWHERELEDIYNKLKKQL